jgi:RNA polymerase sigma-70 factor, ECF subfamily
MRDWVERLQNRDPSALLAIYDRWSRPLLAFIVKITVNQEEAEGILSDVFQTFWTRSADPGFIQGNLFGQLADMARFRALDTVNSRGYSNGKQEWGTFEPRDRFSDSNELRTWEKLALPERVLRAHAALDGLTESERGLIEAAWFEGMTCTRLAMRHHLPVATIREQLSEAIRKLESALEDALS